MSSRKYWWKVFWLLLLGFTVGGALFGLLFSYLTGKFITSDLSDIIEGIAWVAGFCFVLALFGGTFMLREELSKIPEDQENEK